MIANVTFSVLLENTTNCGGLASEHGLSLWIEADGTRILFDAGQSGAFLANAAAMRIDISRADALVLSHGHYDHTGGLAHLPRETWPLHAYLHPAAMMPRYHRHDPPPHKSIGMPAASATVIKQMDERIIWTCTATQITEDIGVTGYFPRAAQFEQAEPSFFVDAACTRHDSIRDDQALWLKTKNGVVVVMGCAHAGVANTLDHICRLLLVDHIYAVIGGLHLGAASDDRIARTADALNKRGVALVAAGHCTGSEAVTTLSRKCTAKVTPLPTGNILLL